MKYYTRFTRSNLYKYLDFSGFLDLVAMFDLELLVACDFVVLLGGVKRFLLVTPLRLLSVADFIFVLREAPVLSVSSLAAMSARVFCLASLKDPLTPLPLVARTTSPFFRASSRLLRMKMAFISTSKLNFDLKYFLIAIKEEPCFSLRSAMAFRIISLYDRRDGFASDICAFLVVIFVSFLDVFIEMILEQYY